MKKENFTSTFSIAQAAKLIGFPGGRQKFYTWLRQKQFLLKDNFPNQKVIDCQWFMFSVPFPIEESFCPVKTIPRITIKGLSALEKIVREEFPICEPCK